MKTVKQEKNFHCTYTMYDELINEKDRKSLEAIAISKWDREYYKLIT